MGDHGYEEVSDLLNRYTTLSDANVELMKDVQQVRHFIHLSTIFYLISSQFHKFK